MVPKLDLCSFLSCTSVFFQSWWHGTQEFLPGMFVSCIRYGMMHYFDVKEAQDMERCPLKCMVGEDCAKMADRAEILQGKWMSMFISLPSSRGESIIPYDIILMLMDSLHGEYKATVDWFVWELRAHLWAKRGCKHNKTSEDQSKWGPYSAQPKRSSVHFEFTVYSELLYQSSIISSPHSLHYWFIRFATVILSSPYPDFAPLKIWMVTAISFPALAYVMVIVLTISKYNVP